jgi:hypothetical protein
MSDTDDPAGSATAKAAAIRTIYAQVQAPEWAAPNLDALVDVLRDLSWLPEGPVSIVLPALDALDDAGRAALARALAQAVDDTIGSARPVQVRQAH